MDITHPTSYVHTEAKRSLLSSTLTMNSPGVAQARLNPPFPLLVVLEMDGVKGIGGARPKVSTAIACVRVVWYEERHDEMHSQASMAHTETPELRFSRVRTGALLYPGRSDFTLKIQYMRHEG